MIFEFWFDPDDPDIYEEYLHASAEVRQHLGRIAGFHGVERFQSCSDAAKFVAIGYFEDEDAVRHWRNIPEHRKIQELGRTRLFADYRLRMAEVVRDYGPEHRAQAPADSQAAHGLPDDR